MISLENKLYFPKLVRLNYDPFKEDHHLFKLDWANQENVFREGHEKWRNSQWKDKDIPFVPSLPPKYDKWVKEQVFALNSAYLDEIRRVSQAAISECNVKRSFDTNIREICLQPSIAFVKVAFLLLGDCIYDFKTNYYSRKPDRYLYRFAAGIKFWGHQTGHGLIHDHAGMNGLQHRMIHTAKSEDPQDREFFDEAGKFIERTERQLKKIYKAMEPVWSGSGDVEGPSLGDGGKDLSENEEFRMDRYQMMEDLQNQTKDELILRLTQMCSYLDNCEEQYQAQVRRITNLLSEIDDLKLAEEGVK